jgi:flagellar biosynthesis protein FliP
MLVTVDLAGFLFLMWKTPKEPLKDNVNEADVIEEKKKENETKNQAENELKKEMEKEMEKEIEKKIAKVSVNIETKTNEKESESEVIIKKIEDVVNESNES